MGWLGESKGCTWFPDGDYEQCCIAHDAAYRGGYMPRAIADRTLRNCIKSHGYTVMAWAVWLVVRAVGWMFYKRMY